MTARIVSLVSSSLALVCMLLCGTYRGIAPAQILYSAQNVQSGLVGWWKLCGDVSATSGCADSSSTTVYDSSGYGNNGTWQSTVAYATGHVGPYAASFNGSSSYIQIGTISSSSNPLMLNGSAFSIVVQAYITSAVSGGRVIDKSTTSNGTNGWGMALGNTGPSLYSNGDPANYTETLPTNTWFCAAWTLTSGGSATYYQNGVQDYNTTGLATPPNASANLNIASWGSSGSRLFEGYLNNLMVFDRVLTQQEIVNLCNVYN